MTLRSRNSRSQLVSGKTMTLAEATARVTGYTGIALTKKGTPYEPHKPRPIVCLHCGGTFLGVGAKPKFCGKYCRREWHTANGAPVERAPHWVDRRRLFK